MSDATSDDLVRWLAGEGLEMLASTDAVLLVDDGEARVRVDRSDDGWIVSKSLRSEPFSARMSSADWEDVDRFVVMLYLGSARESRGLSRLKRLGELGADGIAVAAEGWSVQRGADGGWLLDGPHARRRWFASDLDAAAFSRYAVYSADELRRHATLAEAPLAR